MVARTGNRAGKTHVGCLFTLLLLAGGVYVSAGFAEMFLRAFRLQDLVRTQARYAESTADDVIRGRLVAFSDSLGLSLGSREWTIKRQRMQDETELHQFTISAQYEDSVVIALPGFRHVFKHAFTPSASAQY